MPEGQHRPFRETEPHREWHLCRSMLPPAPGCYWRFRLTSYGLPEGVREGALLTGAFPECDGANSNTCGGTNVPGGGGVPLEGVAVAPGGTNVARGEKNTARCGMNLPLDGVNAPLPGLKVLFGGAKVRTIGMTD